MKDYTTLILNYKYVSSDLPATALLWLILLAKENKYEFKSEDVQRVSNRSESTVRKTFFDKLKGYSTERGPIIKMLPDSRVYQINPYIIYEGELKERRSLHFCFLAGIAFATDPKEIKAQSQLKRLAEVSLKSTKETFIRKLDDAFANGGENLDAVQDFPHLRQHAIRVWELLKGGSYKTAPVSHRGRKILPSSTASETSARVSVPKDQNTWEPEARQRRTEEEEQERMQQLMAEHEEDSRSEGTDADYGSPNGAVKTNAKPYDYNDPSTWSKEEYDERIQKAMQEMEEEYKKMNSNNEISELEDDLDDLEDDDWL